jgi:hypothetical protein
MDSQHQHTTAFSFDWRPSFSAFKNFYKYPSCCITSAQAIRPKSANKEQDNVSQISRVFENTYIYFGVGKASLMKRVAIMAALAAVCVVAAGRARGQCDAPDTLLRTLNNPAPAASDHFGNAVAISGNLAVVGTAEDDPGGVTDAGTAYVFDATTGATISILNHPAPEATDYFGYSVAISGNLAVVGAVADDPAGMLNAGTAYVFDATTGTTISTLNHPALAAGDQFGYSVWNLWELGRGRGDS